MGGVDNRTSRELTSAKQRSRAYHSKINEQLYKEYIESGKQFSQTFAEWKREKTQDTRRSRKEPMQPAKTKKERIDRIDCLWYKYSVDGDRDVINGQDRGSTPRASTKDTSAATGLDGVPRNQSRVQVLTRCVFDGGDFGIRLTCKG